MEAITAPVSWAHIGFHVIVGLHNTPFIPGLVLGRIRVCYRQFRGNIQFYKMMAVRLGRGARSLLQTSSRRPAVRYKASLGVSPVRVDHGGRLKTIDDLPGPSQLESLYWILLRGYIFYMHELEVKLKKKYGPMWVWNIGDHRLVSIASPQLLEALLKQEGKYPMRADINLWKEHRDLRGYPYGPLTEEGHQWQTQRSALNQKMLKPTDAAHYADSLNEIIPDLFNKIEEVRAQSPSGHMVENIAGLMYKFAFESISTVIFETRLGCLSKDIPEENQKFINSITIMLESQSVLERLPRWAWGWLPYWGRFLESWDIIFNYATKLINKKKADIEERLQSGDDLGGAYLTHLLTSGNLDMKGIYGALPEMLQAGVDTTSNTLTWVLYQLAKNPEAQQSLYEEVTRVIPGDTIPGTDDISKMPLLKAVIKETLRMYPVVPENGRVTVEKEVVLDGYIFPKNTQFLLCHYVLSRDESSFPDPDRFLPRRWLRSEGIRHHPFSSIPFGFGVRGCLGRRVAELEMHLVLSQLIRRFQVLPDPKLGDVNPKNRVVLVPQRPINLQFIDRKKN
ncbi:sterol 26-hydroxylase, mitochondrial-like [Engystomops pustulosus]|uniref:sterol 26-hydroxylase, mitochondrial-like n=1 Tax=Engystomops pustulosus TaxID=76066 RepID=UPI003AFA083F